MSELESIAKLRAAGRNMAKDRNLENHEECNLLLVIADEIEAEIAERFMELPCDADGAPIRVGDKLFFDKNDPGICTGYDWLKINDDGKWMIVVRSDWHDGGCRFLAHDSAHHVQRTLEDVLRDVWKEALDYAKSDMWRNPDEVFAERADEIRAMFGEVDR